MHLALYQPDIPQNTGTILRMAACVNVRVDIVGPAGFDLSSRALKRAGLDYLERASFELFDDFEAFMACRIKKERKTFTLASTKAAVSYYDHPFSENEIIMFGRESAGVPEHIHELATSRILIPMQQGTRSLNLAVSTAMITSEALRQTRNRGADPTTRRTHPS